MDVSEALDRDEIVERAEAVRFWLLGFELASRATGAIQRELGAIIAGEPDELANGRRPLAGLTVADFIAELHSLNGGAVGRVKSVGDMALRELRAAIPAQARVAAPVAVEAPSEAPWAEYEAPEEAVQPAPRRRGRPKGSTRAARNGAGPAAHAAQNGAAPVAAAPAAAAAETHDALDPQIDQLLHLWPALHPHARRAVVLFASDLLI